MLIITDAIKASNSAFSTHRVSGPRPSRRPSLIRFGNLLFLHRAIGMWVDRSRQRRALANLDGRMLNDVGITPAAAAREIAKPFWR